MKEVATMQPNYDLAVAVANELAVTENDPLCAYVYDLDGLRAHIQQLVASLPPQFQLFYAAKANAETPVLQVLADQVHGFEVASGGELQWLREHFAEVPLIFGGPGKLESELRAAIDARVELIHVESRLELERLARLADEAGRPVDILLRINLTLAELPSTTLTMGGRPTPFGIDESELEGILAWLASQPNLRLQGFHFHLLSHQLDAAAHLRLLQGYCRQVKRWCDDYRLECRHVNVGGGIGINYVEPDKQFNWPAFSQGLADLVAQEQMEDWTIRFEFGRYVTAACGYYVMEVLDLKRNLGQWFAVARGGTHHFRTPAAQSHSHPFQVVPRGHMLSRAEGVAEQGAVLEGEPVTIVGQLCTPKDVLAQQVPLERVAVGDWLVFPYAGAYAWNISHHDFLRHPRPRCGYFDGGRVVVADPC